MLLVELQARLIERGAPVRIGRVRRQRALGPDRQACRHPPARRMRQLNQVMRL